MVKKKESSNKNLEKKLFSKKENIWNSFKKNDIKNVFQFSEDYKSFLDVSKTERLAVIETEKILKKNKFKNIRDFKSLKVGDKFYKIIKSKCIISGVVGKDKDLLKMIGSHIDSPRLDLKPNPLYEDSDFALLKTHYYGGIKKYQWLNWPLMITGVVFTKDNKQVTINIGDSENDPKFIISDLLPHLARDQMAKEARKLVEGESLNLFVGSIPVNDSKVKEKIKFEVLKKLNKDYGIVEDDFNFAELQVVPAHKSMDLGFDRSLIAGYGQDDKVCAYISLRSLLDQKKSNSTNLVIFFDKEEIGSVGNTGAASLVLSDFVEEYISLTGIQKSVSEVFSNSLAISADVTAGVDPNFKEVNELRNSTFLNKGVAIEKYTGSGGKYSASDANAEYLSYIRKILIKNKIQYQFGELGKIDLGGGGTIALYLAKYGLEIVDVGVPVLGMHSPNEIVSKADVFECYRFYKAFFEF